MVTFRKPSSQFAVSSMHVMDALCWFGLCALVVTGMTTSFLFCTRQQTKVSATPKRISQPTFPVRRVVKRSTKQKKEKSERPKKKKREETKKEKPKAKKDDERNVQSAFASEVYSERSGRQMTVENPSKHMTTEGGETVDGQTKTEDQPSVRKTPIRRQIRLVQSKGTCRMPNKDGYDDLNPNARSKLEEVSVGRKSKKVEVKKVEEKKVEEKKVEEKKVEKQQKNANNDEVAVTLGSQKPVAKKSNKDKEYKQSYTQDAAVIKTAKLMSSTAPLRTASSMSRTAKSPENNTDDKTQET
ncbi:hypothetical protein M3Y95_00423500 [Aphelenchoides besseyi]|nr:hypothetical protein M3Y95_00423500 [Aphelenchoides besseyi]